MWHSGPNELLQAWFNLPNAGGECGVSDYLCTIQKLGSIPFHMVDALACWPSISFPLSISHSMAYWLGRFNPNPQRLGLVFHLTLVHPWLIYLYSSTRVVDQRMISHILSSFENLMHHVERSTLRPAWSKFSQEKCRLKHTNIAKWECSNLCYEFCPLQDSHSPL